MANVKTAIIVGGGIAGPAAALALRKAGIDSTIYEAYHSSAEDLGGVLMIAPNGLNALGIVGLGQTVSAIGQPIERMVMADGRGRKLAEFPGLPGLPASRLMWRSDIYRVLRDAVVAQGIRVEHGKRLLSVSEDGDGITASFGDGARATADILVGADGIHSTVRALIDPQAPAPLPDGLLGFGGEADVSLPGSSDSMNFVFGKRAFLGYWVQPNGKVAWFSNLPREGYLPAAEARAVPAEDWLAQLRVAYAGDVPSEQLVNRTSADGLFVLGSTHMLPEIPCWHRGRMVLVGDAAHAPNHSSGQGVSLAVESAIELARCLRDLDDPSDAFAAYEALRRPRVGKVAAQAARVNQQKAAGPLAGAVMRMVMSLAAKTFMKPEKMFGWVQGFQINWDERVESGMLASTRQQVPSPRGASPTTRLALD